MGCTKTHTEKISQEWQKLWASKTDGYSSYFVFHENFPRARKSDRNHSDVLYCLLLLQKDKADASVTFFMDENDSFTSICVHGFMYDL